MDPDRRHRRPVPHSRRSIDFFEYSTTSTPDSPTYSAQPPGLFREESSSQMSPTTCPTGVRAAPESGASRLSPLGPLASVGFPLRALAAAPHLGRRIDRVPLQPRPMLAPFSRPGCRRQPPGRAAPNLPRCLPLLPLTNPSRSFLPFPSCRGDGAGMTGPLRFRKMPPDIAAQNFDAKKH